MKRTPHFLTSIFAATALTFCTTTSSAFEVLGIGTGALLGGDLTDPEDNGSDSPEPLGGGFNWLSISSNFNAYFDVDGVVPNRQGAFDVFDNKVNNGEGKYCCGGGTWTLAVEFAQSYVLTHFTIASNNDSIGRNPDVWQIQGSDDGITWTDIFVFDNDDVAAPNTRLHAGNSPWTAGDQVIRWNGDGDDFATPAAYKWFRLNADSAAGWVGAGGQLSLAEIELFGTLSIIDTDADGMDDGWEQGIIDADPNDALVTLADILPDGHLDGDTLTNLQEFLFPQTDPLDPDSDDDGLLDDVETGDASFDDLATDTGTDPNDDDTDNDGLLDGVETNDGSNDGPMDRGTHPLIADTDGDTYLDGEEVSAETDPLDPGSNPVGLEILGFGAASFLGGDLTDPENDGTQEGANFNGTFFATAGGDFVGNGDPFDIFTNTSGGNGNKFCCNSPPFQIGTILPEAFVLTHFTLSSSNDSPGRDPDVYRIQGSNDTTDGSDGTWTDIYVYDNDGGLAPTGTATEHRLFPGNTQFNGRDLVIRIEGGGVNFPTPSAYRAFRINMESASGWMGTNGNVGDPPAALALGEMELFGTPGLATPLEITMIEYDQTADTFRIAWSSEPDQVYTLLWSTDLENWVADVSDDIPSGGASTVYPTLDLPPFANPANDNDALFFRVEQN